MKKLFALADAYIQGCTWREIALLKLCLASMGVLLGLLVPVPRKRPVRAVALLLFVGTYVPLMAGFFRSIASKTDR
ncbi:MAG: permease of phosphate ABC transporter [Eubacteriales bacterium]|jgi:hypothetical protein